MGYFDEEPNTIIQKGLWQDETIHDLVNLLEPYKTVQALLLKGSSANPHIQPDTWSDVDVTIVVTDGALNTFFPTTTWLAPLGELYTISQSSTELTGTTRVCFTDFRLDELAASWLPGYHEHRHPLLAWISYAQEMVALQ
jgi:hypothetical protein